jgi:hypothetical protein
MKQILNIWGLLKKCNSLFYSGFQCELHAPCASFFLKYVQNLAHGFSNYSCKRGNLPHRRKRPKELRHYGCGEANGVKNKEFFPRAGVCLNAHGTLSAAPMWVFLLVFVAGGFAFDRTITVGPGEAITTIQAGINACGTQQRCEVHVLPGVYSEQISITRTGLWLHGDLEDRTAVTIQYLDKESTYPRNYVDANSVVHSDSMVGENNYTKYFDQNGVIRVGADSVRISHLTVDAMQKYPVQWPNVWSSLQFSGNSGITIPKGRNSRVDHCEIKNAWFGVYIKGRNTGGVFANLDTWEINAGEFTTPFSDFGKNGGHIVEYNRVYDNTWAFYVEQTYDLGSTFRYNLAWDNYARQSDFDLCDNAVKCGIPEDPNLDRRHQNGGFAFLKDAMLVTHHFYNNTLYNMPHVLHGYHKAGKNHRVYNNIIAHSMHDMSPYHAVGRSEELFGSYSNALHNVMEQRQDGLFPLFGSLDNLWDTDNLPQGGAASPDSFTVGSGNFYYETVAFQSTNPSHEAFLCPDWSSEDVQRTIANKGWGFTDGLRTNEQASVGALWPQSEGCRWGGGQDTIGLRIHSVAPIVFTDASNAKFQFHLSAVNAPDSAFGVGSYVYRAYIDSIPFTSTGSSLGAFPTLKALGDASGVTGAVRFGTNQVQLQLPRDNLGEYGVIYIAVEAVHENGETYRSNIESFEYRRLNYTLQIDFFAKNDIVRKHPLDTVAKGDTVQIQAKILDMSLKLATGNVEFFGPGSDPLQGEYKQPVIKSLLHNSFRVTGTEFVLPITSIGTRQLFVTGSTWGDEVVTMSGYIDEITGSTRKRNFAAGVKTIYIKPAYAAQLVIEDPGFMRAGDTVDVIVDVLDVLGEPSGDSLLVELKSNNSNAQIIQGTKKFNTDQGQLTFKVVVSGAPKDSISLTASATSSGAGKISDTLLKQISNPLGKVHFDVVSQSSGYATGQVVPIDFIFKANNGTSYTYPNPFTIEVYDSQGSLSEYAQLFTDSLYAATGTGDLLNGSASTYQITNAQGVAKLFFRVPDSIKQSDTYLLVTKNPNGSISSEENVYWDSLYVTFSVPELVFVNKDGEQYESLPSIDTTTNFLVPLYLQARVGGVVCTGCTDTVSLIANDPAANIRFKTQEGTPDLSTIILSDGQAELFVYGARQTLNSSFTIEARSGAMTATWDNVNFRKPPVPQVDSALVFDTDGDGIADSLVIFYAEDISDSLPDSLHFAFPGTASPHFIIPSSDLLLSPSIISIANYPLTDSILTQGVGLLQSWYTDNDGVVWRQPVDILDRIGPVIISAKLIENFGGGADSLLVVFSEPLDTNFQFGTPFIVTDGGREFKPTVQGSLINDSTWLFTLGKGQVKQNMDIRLSSEVGGLHDLNGTYAHFNNLPVAIGLIQRPVPPSQKGNFFQDLDGDGRPDHIVITFLGDITPEYLKNSLDSLVLTWLDTNGAVIAFAVPGSALTVDPENPRLVHYSIEDASVFKPNHTYIQSGLDSAQTYGTARMETSVNGVAQSMPILMADGMPPVLYKAVLEVGKNTGDDDRLTLLFSEPINNDNIPAALQGQEFEIKAPGAIEPRILLYSSLEWDAPEKAILTFGQEINYNNRPNSLDSIRVVAGSLPDFADNFPLSDEEFAANHPQGLSRPYVLIRGGVRFKLETISKSAFSPSDPAIEQSPVMEMEFYPFDTNRESVPYLGIMVGVGGKDLEFDIQELLKEKKYQKENIAAEDIQIDPQELTIKVELQLFTSLSGFVAQYSSSLQCTDQSFGGGSCFDNPMKLFIKWNYKSDSGRFVGAGAYVARMRFTLVYNDAQKGSVKVSDRDETAKWGVIRLDSPSVLKP